MTGRQRWLLVVPVLVVAGYALFAGMRWIGGWAGTVDRVSGTTVLTGPVLASVAAGVQVGAARLRPISEVARRGRLVPYRSASEAWLMGVAAYAATLGAAVAATLSVPHGGPAQWWSLVAGVVVLALASLFGAGAARLFPSGLTVVAAGPVLFLLGAFGPTPVPEVLRFGPTGSMTGLQLVPSVQAARVVAAVGICLSLAVAMAPWRDRGRSLALPLAGGVAAALTVGGSVAVLHTATGIGDNRLEPSSEHASVCAGSGPEVCVAPSDHRFLGATAEAFRKPVEVLREAGVTLPARYEERMPYGPASEGSGTFYLDGERGAPRFPDSVSLLTHPADCPQWSSAEGPPYSALDAVQLVVAWAAAREGGRPEAFSPEMERWLPHIDDPATTAWVVTTFAQLRSCDFASIVMPWDLA